MLRRKEVLRQLLQAAQAQAPVTILKQKSLGGEDSGPQLRKQETGKSRKQVSISENPKGELLSPQVETRKVAKIPGRKNKRFHKSLSSEANVVLNAKQVNP